MSTVIVLDREYARIRRQITQIPQKKDTRNSASPGHTFDVFEFYLCNPCNLWIVSSALSCRTSSLIEIELSIDRILIQLRFLQKVPSRQINFRGQVIVPMIVFRNFSQLDRKSILIQKIARGPYCR